MRKMSLPLLLSQAAAEEEQARTKEWFVTYTTRDVLLYAAAIGFGSKAPHYDADLPFVWEDAPDFRVAPAWVTTMPFWGTRQHHKEKEHLYRVRAGL